MYSPVFLSLYEDCVATESTVYGFWLLVVRVSASLPANPMSETWFRYMMICSVFELLICSGHTGRSLAQGPAPKCRSFAFTVGLEKCFRVLCERFFRKP